MIRETLQSFCVDTVTFLAFTASDNDSLVGDGELSGTPTLTAPRVCEPLIESAQLFDDSVRRCSSQFYWRPVFN